MNSLFKGGREIPWGSGWGPGGKDRGRRDEKCEPYSRDMKFFKLRRDKYTQWDIWKDLKVRAGRTPRDGPFVYLFLPSSWVLLKGSVHQTNCVLN